MILTGTGKHTNAMSAANVPKGSTDSSTDVPGAAAGRRFLRKVPPSLLSCGEIAHFYEYSLLEGPRNLTFWLPGTNFRNTVASIVKTDPSNGEMMMSIRHLSQESAGHMSISLWNGILRIWNKRRRYDIPVEEIAGLVLTRKDELSFDVGEKTYFFKFKDPMLFFDAINWIKGVA